MIVGEGSYLLRYVSAGAPNHPPVVRVKASPKDGKGVSLVPVTDDLGRGLRSPGDYMLVHAKRTGAIDLTVSNRPNGSLEAEVRLERIAAVSDTRKKISGRAPAAAVTAAPATAPMRVAAKYPEADVEFLAHVSHRGDVLLGHGEWICGPDCPMPIEGIEIRWLNMPAGVSLGYEVAAGVRRRERSREMQAGQFAGSRGEATPLVGIKLRLLGPSATQYELVADALFLGSQIDSRSGQEIFFAGATGREPLVGLRLSIVTQQGSSRSERAIDGEVARHGMAKSGAVKTEAMKNDMTRKFGPLVMKQVGGVRVYRPARGSAS